MNKELEKNTGMDATGAEDTGAAKKGGSVL